MAKTVDVTVDTRYVLWYNSDSKLKQDNIERAETEDEKNANKHRNNVLINKNC